MTDKKKLSVESFVATTLQLLEKERETEIEEKRLLSEKLPPKELQRRGVCLLKLHIASRKTGLYGRAVIVFETHHDSLPSHSFTPGDIVGLNHSNSDIQSESLGSGLVTKVSQSAISIAFDDTQDLFSLEDGYGDYYKLTKLANDVTYKRLKRTLGNLNKLRHGECAQLVSVLFGEQELSRPYDLKDIHFINPNLDDSQQDAVRFSLGQREVAVVHGPPGTGKTTTVIEIILQAVKQSKKILACAPSNIAVDNLVERLATSKHRLVRLGHPARLLPHIQKYSLDAILSTSDDTRLVEDVRRDLDKALSSLKKVRDQGEKRKVREDMKFLRKELRQREDAATRDILKRADVVLVTLTSATDDGPMKLLEESHFDIVIIDEVSQAMEAACWIPLLRTRKCILAGDHLQLPPTILSKVAAKEGLDVTLMERILDLYGESVMKMLTMQYRMNDKIMQWSSEQLYDSKLIAHQSVKDHLLRDLPDVEDDDVSGIPLLYIDTAGCDLTELDLPEEISKGNEGEADIVAAHVGKLVCSGLKQEDIAVIAPYNLQVELIRLRLGQLYPKVEVKSVDGFQGREKEAVVISLVRSNPRGEVGFLSERRRINVAVTRARRHLTVVGDSITVSNDAFLKSLIDYLNSEGEVQTAQQYIDDGILYQNDVSRPEHLDDLISLPKHSTNKGSKPKLPKPVVKTDVRKTKERKKPDLIRGSQTPDTSYNTKGVLEDPKVTDYQEELNRFMVNDKVDMLEFPNTLNSHDRLVVHELSEKMGLAHISKGLGNERYIIVTKPYNHVQGSVSSSQSDSVNKSQYKANQTERKSSADFTDEDSAVTLQQDDSKKTENKKNDSNTKDKINLTAESSNPGVTVISDKLQCKICNKDVNKSNIQLHELHCAKQEHQKQKGNEFMGECRPKNVSKSAKPRQFDKELAKRVENVDKDDIDALIATVKKMDNFCCFKKCKTSVQTLFNLCCFCEGRYCMSHHTPEVHGCGEAARAHARAQINKDGVLYRGSGKPNTKPDASKKAHLHKRLDSKLSEMSAKRKSKPKK